ncbi:uncharacterized protein [Argopecten irradians]|uniref:uncharacterized protein n=1 Tax=Argopecten irradians TaxID=31199 RepID=UPI0037107BB6
MKNQQMKTPGVIQMDLISTQKQTTTKHQQRTLLSLRLITRRKFPEKSQGIKKVKNVDNNEMRIMHSKEAIQEDNIDIRMLKIEEAIQMDLQATKKQNLKKMYHLRPEISLHPIILGNNPES